jgi:hypothetical protein
MLLAGTQVGAYMTKVYQIGTPCQVGTVGTLSSYFFSLSTRTVHKRRPSPTFVQWLELFEMNTPLSERPATRTSLSSYPSHRSSSTLICSTACNCTACRALPCPALS